MIAESKRLGLLSFPGVLTPTECFAALGAGADGLKVFPAFQMGQDGLRAIRAVLPSETRIFMVGGVGPENFGDWVSAGADGGDVYLAHFTSIDPPFEAAEAAGAAFIDLTQARGLPAAELALLRLAYEHVLG